MLTSVMRVLVEGVKMRGTVSRAHLCESDMIRDRSLKKP